MNGSLFTNTNPTQERLYSARALPQAISSRSTPAGPGLPATQLSVTQFLRQVGHLPAKTAAVGLCEDGLPVLFDLSDARTGPLLVTGEEGSGKTRLLQNLLRTLVNANAANTVQYLIIATRPEEYDTLAGQGLRTGHCQGLYSPDEPEAAEAILRLAELAENRYQERRPAPAILLVIDGLEAVTAFEEGIASNFEWLVKNGPAVQVWPVGALPTPAALAMKPWIRYFRTRLVGHMPANAAERLGVPPQAAVETLQSGRQFTVRVGGKWLQFWLPLEQEAAKTPAETAS